MSSMAAAVKAERAPSAHDTQAYVFDADTLRPVGVPIDLTPLGEPQGEGIAAAPGGVVVLVGESESTGTVVWLQCELEEAGGTDDAP